MGWSVCHEAENYDCKIIESKYEKGDKKIKREIMGEGFAMRQRSHSRQLLSPAWPWLSQLYSAQCAVHRVHGSLCRVHCTLYTIWLSQLYSAQCAVHRVHGAVEVVKKWWRIGDAVYMGVKTCEAVQCTVQRCAIKCESYVQHTLLTSCCSREWHFSAQFTHSSELFSAPQCLAPLSTVVTTVNSEVFQKHSEMFNWFGVVPQCWLLTTFWSHQNRCHSKQLYEWKSACKPCKGHQNSKRNMIR